MNKQKKRILIVDDEPDNSLVFRIGLEDNGFEVNTFNDPILALSNFKPDTYDLLILDIKMPTINGFQLYEEMKKIDDKVKVCFLTAFGEGYNEEFRTRFPSSNSSSSSFRSTNVTFIRKPIAVDHLVKKVNEII
jgi:DNA-binding NtrC family response regulator